MIRNDASVGGGGAPLNNRFPLQNRLQVLKKYTTILLKLRSLAEQTYNVRPFYFDNYVLFQYFQQCASSNASVAGSASSTMIPSLAVFKMELLKQILDRRRQILCYLTLAFLCVFVYRHEGTSLHSVTERSMHFVYPSMRIWRRITLPLIQRFPRLTELYDEPCLMENPFFQLGDLSCEPCAHVHGVLDLSQTRDDEHSKPSIESATPPDFVPFVFKIDQFPIELDDFYNIYARNQKIFQRDAYRVHSTNNAITNLEELFSQFNHSYFQTQQQQQQQPREQQPQPQQKKQRQQQQRRSRPPFEVQAHSMWRCNRMLPARLLRQLFPRPGSPHFPNTGIALERYMTIDTPQAAAFTLPDTECSNVYVQQASGTRFIILRPTSECRYHCRTLSIRLSPSLVLSYNWLYWKPISAPDPVSETLSISLIGSYC